MNWEKIIGALVELTRLSVTYGAVIATPAKEVKRMKLRQLEKEMKEIRTSFKEE